ncbi:YheC/YheD family protein [Enterococcus raffinosus]|uniref:YheC/YheD family protein n=1 Tax=Enterococcus raffinosus TaxID=71452 RepID=A0AAW8TB80_9ENTE|nr:YheC/YheD family protein [Enterococcus raffinosus]MDT2521736.1 YheC/YheD family protein [Enterococcus raffinosus]MDT2529045.1 YheC/YheD family protein [Enterococcus raffinosus]MDT2532749.1 YheC/YheD family protein [Enterococcus raffinosus]MDT2545532.1 YheC/YheD family protein [Enterococcus raffinosus]MDT2554674.1 YheC/YheD family protein [Enterococcus raffinosus]
MRVGMMRNGRKPGIVARLTSYVCDHYGMDFIFFSPEDINFEEKTINALVYINGDWKEQQTGFPLVIDNEILRDQNFMMTLDRECYLTNHILGSKQIVFEKLKNAGGFEDVLIPYEMIASVEDIYKFIDLHGCTLLKPIVSNQGRNIYTVDKVEGKLKVDTDGTSEYYSEEDFLTFYDKTFKRRNYIAQPFIDSKTKQGDPFDIRLHVRKDIHGNWKNVAVYPRIGIGKGITSNISQGGGVSPLNAFLQAKFGDEWSNVKKTIMDTSRWFPHKFEDLYDYDFDAFGIDFGIDSNGKMWLFEVNTFPGSRYFFAEDAELRAQYYKYCAEKYGINKESYFKTDWLF